MHNFLFIPDTFKAVVLSGRENYVQIYIIDCAGTRWCSWLSQCATCWKAAGSLLDDINLPTAIR